MATKEKMDNLVYQLTERYGFDRGHALDAADRLMRKDRVYTDFVNYTQTGQATNNKYGGYTLTQLMNDYGLSPVGAFLMLYELEEDAVKGQYYLNQIRIQGHRNKKVTEEGKVEYEFRSVKPSKENEDDPKKPNCSVCGKDLTWIEQYKRWYCYECKDYR